MRPRRKILLIDADETRRGILAYTLDIQRYHVLQVASVAEAWIAKAWGHEPDLILGRWPLPVAEFDDLWRRSETPCFALLGSADTCPSYIPRIVSPTTEDLLNQIKTLTARKRGPKGPRVNKGNYILNSLGEK